MMAAVSMMAAETVLKSKDLFVESGTSVILVGAAVVEMMAVTGGSSPFLQSTTTESALPAES